MKPGPCMCCVGGTGRDCWRHSHQDCGFLSERLPLPRWLSISELAEEQGRAQRAGGAHAAEVEPPLGLFSRPKHFHWCYCLRSTSSKGGSVQSLIDQGHRPKETGPLAQRHWEECRWRGGFRCKTLTPENTEKLADCLSPASLGFKKRKKR